MNRRERMFGIAEKLPKRSSAAYTRRKIVALASHRAGKQR
jgi:hypothetical protein